MKIKAKVVGVREYSFQDQKTGNTLQGQNVFVTFKSEGVKGEVVDTFKNFESRTKQRVPNLVLAKEYTFILSTNERGSKSIELIYDENMKEVPMLPTVPEELPFD